MPGDSPSRNNRRQKNAPFRLQFALYTLSFILSSIFYKNLFGDELFIFWCRAIVTLSGTDSGTDTAAFYF